MNQKILIVDSYYKNVINYIYADFSSVKFKNWSDYYDHLMFGTGFSYKFYLENIGYNCDLLVANNYLQYGAQLIKNKSNLNINPAILGRVAGDTSLLLKLSRLHSNLLNYIEEFKPDIIFVQDLNLFPPYITKIIKKSRITLVGEIASKLPPFKYLYNYDLIISSLPNLVQKMRSYNVNAINFQLGFDARINSRLNKHISPTENEILFVGSITSKHLNTIPLLKMVGNYFPNLVIYGNMNINQLKKNKLFKFYRGQAWGQKMFSLIKNSLITLNRHGSISGPYANNMRLFESTGMGSTLLTEYRVNLPHYFQIDKEIVTYNDPLHACKKISLLLNNSELRDSIRLKGQLKTLNTHTYEILTNKLSGMFNKTF